MVDDSRDAKVLIDPMRRAILELLREKPMTQTQLANELGLTAPSLSYHMKVLKSKRFVTIFNKKVGSHGIVQIFFTTSAYVFIYDLKALPRGIARYFFPVALERTRAMVSALLLLKKGYTVEKDSSTITDLSVKLSDLIVSAASSYTSKNVTFGKESIIFEIYTKALKNLIK